MGAVRVLGFFSADTCTATTSRDVHQSHWEKTVSKWRKLPFRIVTISELGMLYPGITRIDQDDNI